MEVEMANTTVSKESEDDEPIQIRPRFYPSEVVNTIHKSAETPPIVMPSIEPFQLNTAAVAKGVIGALARLIGDKCIAHRQNLQGQIDHELRSKINKKKLAMGLKIESAQKASYQTEEEYEQSM